MRELEEFPLENPKKYKRLNNSMLLKGIGIPALKQLQVISADDFEAVVLEWATDYLKNKYEHVIKIGGAGDKGRDVIGYYSIEKKECDYYQCKHYKSPLGVSTVYLELAKLCYYTFNDEIPVPNNYYFVAPQGITSNVQNFIDNPHVVYEELKKHWDKNCKSAITKKKIVELEGDFLDYVKNFDFNILRSKAPNELISEHAETNWHASRFGTGLRSTRDYIKKAGQNVDVRENIYVEQLLKAYSDKLGKEVINSIELTNIDVDLKNHFNESRNAFYCAESLLEFERDKLSIVEVSPFNELKDEVYTVVKTVLRLEHTNAFVKVLKTTESAVKNEYSSNALHGELKNEDKEGVCHHLVNEEKIKWV
ncbi:MAG: ABC-three component system protein [Algibacter sp.]